MSSGLGFDKPSRDLLVQAAWGDFVHDFDDPIRAVVTVGILNQVPIEQTQSIKNVYGTLVELISAASNRKQSVTAFQLFRSFFLQTMPAVGETVPPVVLHEDDITRLSGIPYGGIMKNLTTVPTVFPLPIPIENGTLSGHAYKVLAVPEKSGGNHAHMVSCLNNLTGALSFVIMWDAGSCEISEIGSAFDPAKVIPNFQTNQTYNIFFINSKENLSDPAPKPTASTLFTSNPNVNIYFLEEADENSTTIYPIYPGDLKDQNANLFSGYKLVTARGKGKTVSGTLFTGSTPPVVVNVEDIKEASKVNSAVSNAVLAKLLKRPVEEQMAYFFLKRAGDWCQALALLDKNRKYKVTAAGVKGGRPPIVPWTDQITTLADLESKSASILLITNDRVLLSYGILLGLNVIFTNVRNAMNWLIYFKNEDAGKVDDAPVVIGKGNANIQPLSAFIAMLSSYIQTLQNTININIGKLNTVEAFSTPNRFGELFTEIRDAAYKIARLPSIDDMNNIRNIMITSLQSLQQGINANILGKLRSANSSYESARSISESIHTTFYPDIEKDKAIFNSISEKIMKGETLSSASDVYIQYQNLVDMIKKDKEKTNLIVLTKLQNIDQVLLTAGIKLGQIRASRTTPGSSSVGFLYSYYNRQFGFQQGGKHKKLRLRGGEGSPGFKYYTDNHVTPYISNAKTIIQYESKTADDALTRIDNDYFIAKNGNYIRLLNGRYESVIDGFIETGFSYESFNKIGDDLLLYPNFHPEGNEGQIDAWIPIYYHLFKVVMNEIDYIYNELLGLQSLEYSNLDALKKYTMIRQRLEILRNILNGVEYFEDEDELVENENISMEELGGGVEPQQKERFVKKSGPRVLNRQQNKQEQKRIELRKSDLQAKRKVAETNKEGVKRIAKELNNYIKNIQPSIISKNPEETIAELYELSTTEGGKAFIDYIYRVGNRTEDRTVFDNETGPQIVYGAKISELIGWCMICQEQIHTLFSIKLEPMSVLEFSRSLENTGVVLQSQPNLTEIQTIEQAITKAAVPNTVFAIEPQPVVENDENMQLPPLSDEEAMGLGGGSHLEIRSPLYRNAKTGTSSSSNNERLQQRSRSRTTYRVRKSSRKSKRRR